jgi:hypothetical protein
MCTFNGCFGLYSLDREQIQHHLERKRRQRLTAFHRDKIGTPTNTHFFRGTSVRATLRIPGFRCVGLVTTAIQKSQSIPGTHNQRNDGTIDSERQGI